MRAAANSDLPNSPHAIAITAVNITNKSTMSDVDIFNYVLTVAAAVLIRNIYVFYVIFLIHVEKITDVIIL